MTGKRDVLVVADLSVAYDRGRIRALDNFNLVLQEGVVGAIVGPNGAGKSSCVSAIAGFMGNSGGVITQGSIAIDGGVVNGKRPHQIASLGVSLIPERNKVFLELTPAEHFRLATTRKGDGGRGTSSARMNWVLELFPELTQQFKRAAGHLSGGQRQMLAIATALLRNPRLLIIDEFSQGLAPIVVSSLSQKLREINRGGTTILLVEQNPRLALSLADQLVVLDGGRVMGEGTPASLRASSKLADAYLGVDR
jgi:branched-chain amino acid transport system ATP-binding protein